MKKLTNKQIIEDFKLVHKDLYDYDLVNFINTRTKVKIICKEHGVFEQMVNNHKRGEGCPLCGSSKARGKKSLEQFIEESILKHGNEYDYSKVNYKGANDKVIIKHVRCGNIFQQTPNQHLRTECPCIKCSYKIRGENRKSK